MQDFYKNEVSYNNIIGPTYWPLNYRQREKTLKVGTKPKNEIERIKEVEIEENPI